MIGLLLMRKRIMRLIKALALFLIPASVFAEGFRTEVGISSRPGAMNASASYEFNLDGVNIGPEIEYIDFGEQPHTDTRNRAVNINLRGSKREWFIEPFMKIGLTSTYFSDPYNDFDWDKGFKGWNFGGGLNFYPKKNVYVQAYVNNIHYVQCSQDGTNDYLYYSFGIGFKL